MSAQFRMSFPKGPNHSCRIVTDKVNDQLDKILGKLKDSSRSVVDIEYGKRFVCVGG